MSIDQDKSKVTMAQLVRDLREQMPMQLEINQLLAQITRSKYLALIGQGFTPDQALQLCK